MSMSISRFVLLAATSLLIAVTAAAKDGEPVKIFLLGGQSNMNGYGSVADLKPPYDVPFPNVKIWDGSAKQWIPLAPKGQSFGPEISFGHGIAAAIEGDIRLIKYAANGTALYDDWAPAKGAKYSTFMRTVKGALADLDARGVRYEIAGMLWLQGESDAKEGRGEDYEKNLTAFIAHVRMELGNPTMNFLIARVRNYYGKGVQATLPRNPWRTTSKM